MTKTEIQISTPAERIAALVDMRAAQAHAEITARGKLAREQIWRKVGQQVRRMRERVGSGKSLP